MGIKLSTGQKKVGTAADTGIDALLLPVMVCAGEGIFRALFPGHIKLFRGELGLPFSIGFYDGGNALDLVGPGIEDR